MTGEGQGEQSKAKRSPLKTGCLIAGLGIAGLAVIGTLMNGGAPSPKPATEAPGGAPAKEPEYVKATANEIFAAYQANQLSAAKRFADRPLEVSGTIHAIDESFGSPVLQLATANQFMPLRAEFPKDATDALASKSKGEKVTVRCQKLLEAGGFLSLKDCSL